jgi:CRP/FNR family transcriptional regulator
MTDDTWSQRFPGLAAGDAATRALLAGAATLELPADQAMFHAGAPCHNYVLVLAGSIRVQVIGEGGREAVLYRVLPGQACVLTTCCILSGENYPAEGYTESPVRILSITKPAFDRALGEAPAFRQFVFANLGSRIAEVITRMEELAFQPIERRLAAFLAAHAEREPSAPLSATHQEIATELGTAREVVSRHLKRMEVTGVVRLGRSQIEVLDRTALQRIIRDAQ